MDRALVTKLVALRARPEPSSVTIEAEGVTTRITLAHGSVVAVEESVAGEPLGRVLVRKRLLTQEQYLDALERMTSALGAGESVRLGEVVVALGYVCEDDVRRALTEQIRGRAMRVLSRREPTWKVEQLPSDRDASRDVALSLEALVLDALRWVDDERKLAFLAAVEGQALRAVWPIAEIDERFELTAEEALVARRVLAGHRLVRDVVEVDSAEVDVHALVAALLATGAAESRARISVADPLEAASAPKRARAMPQPLPEWATIDAVKAKGAMVRTVSRGTMTAAAVADVERTLRAEQAFQRGKSLLRQGRTRPASDELARAKELDPSNAEYALYAAWAAYSAGGEGAIDVVLAEELDRLAREALAVTPSLAFAHVVQGELARMADHQETARRHLRHALRLEPGVFASERALRSAVRTPRPVPAEAVTEASPSLDEGPRAGEGAAPAAAPLPATSNGGAPRETAPAPGVTPDGATSAAGGTAAEPRVEARPPERSRARGIAMVAAVVVLAGGVLAARSRLAPTPAPATATAPVATPSSPSTTAPLSTSPPVVASTSPPVVASTSPPVVASTSATIPAPFPAPAAAPRDPSDVASAPTPASSTGTLVLPPSAFGRRVAVDGKVLGDGTARMTVPCGRHTVRIGKNGKDTSLTIPCGGELAVR